MNRKILATTAVAFAALAFSAAKAGPVNATLSASWFEVKDHTDPDFNVNTTPVVTGGLNAAGMPTADSGVNDIVGGELTWWDPSKNANVIAISGPGSISLPYVNDNLFAPDNGGNNNETSFLTAYFTGTFDLAGPGTVSFDLGSDDDSFIYIDGNLIGQNPGVHGLTTVTFDSGNLTAGDHTLKVFFDDRQNTQAALHLTVDSDVVITPGGGAPEPAAWAMMLVGFFGLGSMVRFVSRKTYLATGA